MVVKRRHVAAIMVVAFSVLATPGCIEWAALIRGCKQYGGEYLLVVIGLVVAVVILETAREYDERQARHKENALAMRKLDKPQASAEREIMTS